MWMWPSGYGCALAEMDVDVLHDEDRDEHEHEQDQLEVNLHINQDHTKSRKIKISSGRLSPPGGARCDRTKFRFSDSCVIEVPDFGRYLSRYDTTTLVGWVGMEPTLV